LLVLAILLWLCGFGWSLFPVSLLAKGIIGCFLKINLSQLAPIQFIAELQFRSTIHVVTPNRSLPM